MEPLDRLMQCRRCRSAIASTARLLVLPPFRKIVTRRELPAATALGAGPAFRLSQ